jgi:hypothetical protein
MGGIRMFGFRSLLLLAGALLVLTLTAPPASADGDRGTAAEAAGYARREAETPALETFEGGFLGGVVAAIVAVFSGAVEAIIDLFGGDETSLLESPDRQSRALADPFPRHFRPI